MLYVIFTYFVAGAMWGFDGLMFHPNWTLIPIVCIELSLVALFAAAILEVLQIRKEALNK